ncbi:hypothetical protein [Desulfoluna limicola]|uniref:hypothetical protein n=1 Tax=Desulfoluna limicola TaxID=2810562 RepID=UPI001F390BEB|nr:hypothetical protein [Desulfoluna limicola]
MSAIGSEVAHLIAGDSQVKDASGGPAGGQTFEKFDKQVLVNDFRVTLKSKAHPQPAFKVAHLAAGGSQVKDASGGPAGGQTFEKFDKQVLVNDFRVTLKSKADVICPEERGAKRIRNLLSRWHTLPPEARFAPNLDHRRPLFVVLSLRHQQHTGLFP